MTLEESLNGHETELFMQSIRSCENWGLTPFGILIRMVIRLIMQVKL